MIFGGKKLKDVIVDSSLLTLATFVISYPYLYHWLVHKPDQLSPYNERVTAMTSQQIAMFDFAEIAMFMIAVFLSSFIGFGFSEKYKLKGLGSLAILKKDIIYILVIAVPLNIAIFFAFDRMLMQKIPTLYPNVPVWGLAKAFLTSSTFEIVSKFGLVTIVMGVFKNRHVAVILPAVFFAFIVRNTFADYGVEYGFNYLAVAGTLSTLIYGIVSGYVYIKRGLLTAMALRFVLDLKYLIYPLLAFMTQTN